MMTIRRISTILTVLLVICAELRADNVRISGVINRYARVLLIDHSDSSIVVDSAIAAPCDLVLIIQMQGAVIDGEPSANYGRIIDTADAGHYEFARVASVTANTIRLAQPLSHTYAPLDRVQIVFVPEYDVVEVVAPVVALPWNGETGGIIALVANNLLLSSNIDVSSAGFRGGVVAQESRTTSFVHSSTIASTPNPALLGAKGEGIAGYGAGTATSGRGAPANAGGGGGNHNAGGGGGSNGGAGGDGGWAYTSGKYTGDNKASRGLGARSLYWLLATDTTAARVFMGGGGGAPHENDSVGTNGARGGGIIIVRALRVIDAGGLIDARGADAVDTRHDGAGGGGAGGSVLLDVDAFEGTVRIDISGGSGGDAGDPVAEMPHGPGGGGGGGVIRMFDPDGTIATMRPRFTGGASGSDLVNVGSYGAANGTVGAVYVHGNHFIATGDSRLVLSAPADNGELQFLRYDSTSTITHDVTLTNIGTQVRTITGVRMRSSSSFTYPQEQFPMTIAPGGRATLRISFQSQSYELQRDTIEFDGACDPVLALYAPAWLPDPRCASTITILSAANAIVTKVVRPPFPQPSSEHVTLVFDVVGADADVLECDLVDVHGSIAPHRIQAIISTQQVGEQGVRRITYDLAVDKLATGMYMLRIATLRGVESFPVVIER